MIWDVVWQFAYNLRIPFTIITVVGIVLCIAFGWQATKQRIETNYASTANEDARYRQWVALQGACLLALLWVFVFAIPAPTFKREVVVQTKVERVPLVRTVTKYAGVKVVEQKPTYQRFFDNCMTRSSYVDTCHGAAIEAMKASGPQPQVLVRRVPSPFLDIFEKCNTHGAVQTTAEREARIKHCKEVALEGSKV